MKLIQRFILALTVLLAQPLMAGDTGQSRVSVTKAIPCQMHEILSGLKAEYGQPTHIEWARAEGGQLSRFNWLVSGSDNTVSVTTYLPDGGSCILSDADHASHTWIKL